MEAIHDFSSTARAHRGEDVFHTSTFPLTPQLEQNGGAATNRVSTLGRIEFAALTADIEAPSEVPRIGEV